MRARTGGWPAARIARAWGAQPAAGRGPAAHRGPSCGRDTHDDGLATVVMVAGLAALLVIVTLATWLAAAVIARHRAAGAADLAALAGAAVVVRGADAACAEAVRIADANGASLKDCRVTGADVRIVSGVELRIGPIAGTATARARAGPVAAVVGTGPETGGGQEP